MVEFAFHNKYQLNLYHLTYSERKLQSLIITYHYSHEFSQENQSQNLTFRVPSR